MYFTPLDCYFIMWIHCSRFMLYHLQLLKVLFFAFHKHSADVFEGVSNCKLEGFLITHAEMKYKSVF